MKKAHQALQISLLLTLASLSLSIQAQVFPDKPITIVVGYPPGGSTDATGRAVAESLARILKTSVVVENVGGAGGVIGAKKVIDAKPDGYTLLLGANNELAIAPLISPSANYAAGKDMTPLRYVSAQPIVLVASKKSGVTTLAQFVEVVKKNPGKFSYGSSGVGTALNLAGEMVKEKAGLYMTHIPYRGVAPLMNDIMGDNIEFGMFVLSSALTQIQSGRVVAIAVTELSRAPQLPNVPAFSEHPSLKGVSISSWFMLMAPKRLDPAVQKILEAASAQVLKDSVFRKRLEDIGSRVATGEENTNEFLVKEVASYKRSVEFARIKTD